jgi:hypothetical protein
MGAEWFTQDADGADVSEAFRVARAAAQYEHGHGGYSGTLAEKDSWVLVRPTPVSSYAEAEELADRYAESISGGGHLDTLPHFAEVNDKWGAAGVVEFVPDPPRLSGMRTGHRSFLFFGWASS